MRILFTLLCAIALAASYTSRASADNDWSSLNTIGLLNPSNGDGFDDDIWDDYTESEALALLNKLPNRLRSPAYLSTVRKLLLTPAEELDDTPDNSTRFLATRIELLIQYGLFEDAQNLYNTAVSQMDGKAIPAHLAYASILLSLTKGDLPAACLDIKVHKESLQEAPKWQDLSQFCQIRFGDTQKQSAADISFSTFTNLEDHLLGPIKTPDHLKLPEILIAFADDNIDDTLYSKMAKTNQGLDNLLIKLASDVKFKDRKTYQCYVIESTVRGFLSADELPEAYKLKEFSDKALKSMDGTVTLHPCDVPSYFYQRSQMTESNIDDIDFLLSTSQSIPIYVLTPFLPSQDNILSLSPPAQWKAYAIAALTGQPFDETTLSKPLKVILNNESLNKEELNDWQKAMHSGEINDDGLWDYNLPLYLSISNSSDLNNFERNTLSFNYDNEYSLTYVKKSLHSAVGIVNALRQYKDDDDIPKMIVTALAALGKYSPNMVTPHNISGIITSLNDVKLTNEKQIITIEVLL